MDLIVNADDLGMSPEINQGIFGLMEQKVVTSATLLANSPYVEEAAAQTGRFTHCSFGAHLNVTEFQPLGRGSGLEPLLDTKGQFGQQRFRQATIDATLSQAIFEEFCAQIEKLISLGVQVSHLDSHHYVFSGRRMFPMLKRILKKYRIKSARISRNVYADRLPDDLDVTPYALGIDPDIGYRDVGKTMRLKKLAYNFALRHYHRTNTTDGFSGFRLFYESAKLRNMTQKTFEVNVHPENPFYDAGEVDVLKGSWQEEISFPIRLISYHELT